MLKTNMRKTKIICTIGPSSGDSEVIGELVGAGMNVARLNFSHGSHEEHAQKMRLIRAASEESGKPVAILQDLCGPKIRVGEIPDPGIRLDPGQRFVLTSDIVVGTKERVSVSYANLPGEVKTGDQVLLADGAMELVVTGGTATDIFCEVLTGGRLTSSKGINLPTGTIKADTITEKDIRDLRFGLKIGVDYVALSFVRSAEDILRLKQMIKDQGRDTPVIAKIEKHEALENIDSIMEACDGLMVARGDLGVEIPLENVPGIQKMLIRKANASGKPVIIATQMLRSMVNALRPTRAEATDVANAVLDGADAVMLSEETASGEYPVEAVRFMTRIVECAEKDFPHVRYLRLVPKKGISESVAHASCVLADHLDAGAIVATTRSGYTAKQISRYRPKQAIIAPSPEKSTVRRLSLYWGCLPCYAEDTRNTDERIENAEVAALKTGAVKKGDLVVVTTGHPVWSAGTTNMVRVKKL